MTHVIGRGRYAREAYPERSNTISDPGELSVLTFQPQGSAGRGQFTDFALLYAAFLKTNGQVLICFDGTFAPGGICTLPGGTFDMQGRATWSDSGIQASGGVQVAIPDGGIVKNLRGFFGAIQLNTASTGVSPLQFDGLPFASPFNVGAGASFLQTGAAAVIAIAAGQTAFITLADAINVNSFPAFGELISLGAASSLVLFVYEGLNFFNGPGKLISGPVGSTLIYAVDASWIGNPANPNFLGATTTLLLDTAPNVAFTAAVPAQWAPPPPANASDAINRLAAAVSGLLGGPIP